MSDPHDLSRSPLRDPLILQVIADINVAGGANICLLPLVIIA